MAEKKNYGTATVRIESLDGLARLEIVGVVTEAICAALVHDLAAVAQGQDALLVDWTRAVTAFAAEALYGHVADAATRGRASGAAVALLVSPDNAALFRAYCRLMTSRGLVRVVFEEPEKALRWARQQSALAIAERCYRDRIARSLARALPPARPRRRVVNPATRLSSEQTETAPAQG